MKEIITHLYALTSRIILSILIVSFSVLPLHAYQDRFAAFNDNHGLRSSINAGFRLTIPFGPTKKSEDKVKYGFQLNVRHEFNNNVSWSNYGHMTTTQTLNADIISLNFSENGFKNLSLAGQQALIFKDGVLMATDDEKGSGKGWYIAGGVVLVLLASGLLAVIAIKNDINN